MWMARGRMVEGGAACRLRRLRPRGEADRTRMENCPALRDVAFGKLRSAEALGPLIVVIGKRGAGGISLFDAVGFLAARLHSGVAAARDTGGQRV